MFKWFDRFRKSGNLPVFVVFLIISFGFWFLNALRKSYVVDVQVPVRFVDVPVNQLVDFQADSLLNLRIRADGFEMLRNHLISREFALMLELGKLPHFRHADVSGVYCIPRRMTRTLLNSFSANIEILEFQPDTLFIGLSRAKRKIVDVALRMDVECSNQHMVTGDVVVEPSKVVVKGTPGQVDTLKFVATELLSEKQASDTLRRIVRLKAPAGVVLEPAVVNVMVPIENYTEKSLYLDISARNLPQDKSFKSFPTQVIVNFQVGLSRFNRITSSDFMAVVDFSDFSLDKAPDRMKVRLEMVPPWIQNISYSPIFVEYLLEKERSDLPIIP